MSGDYSRIRFTPQRDVSGVLMQQGRVQLDSDWNEWVETLDRRLRAETVDILGVHPPAGIEGVAVVPATTPDGFRIEATGGALTIGRGRMYVNGLLAENHGGGAPEFDRVLAEQRGQSPLAYNQQPYHPNPPALPTAGPHLAYLEVWQREVTHIEQPDLVEPALGVDTTTRMQTVWQVRLHSGIGTAGCTTPDASVTGWPALIRPSAGRLSSRAVGVPPGSDPCELPPGGGYRGLENQLYRIEIHDGGGIGQASFKWSRDNASVASLVTEIVTSSELRLASLGRDAVLRFSSGDWVEIVDDWRELSGENGNPALRRGVMRRITVDDAKQTISFTPALPADMIPSGTGNNTLAKRHLRVRRWDQKGVVRDAANNVITNLDLAASSGLIPINTAGVWINLEHGVQVRFDAMPAGTGMRSGDHWSFTARTADASVEALTSMPPRGIHRHYARLAIVNFPDGEDDCRIHWPPSCGGCCTVVVAPGGDIQAALDSLPIEGGCVCLKTGVHNVSNTLFMRNSRVILRGEGPGAIVRSSHPLIALQIGGESTTVTDIAVEGIRFEATVAAENAMIVYVDDCRRLRIEHCEMVATPQLSAHIGMYLNDVAEVNITGNRLQRLVYGIWVNEYLERIEIRGNLLEGILYDFAGGNNSWGQYGLWIDAELARPVTIEDNLIRHFWVGVYLRRRAEGSVVSGNRILRSTLVLADEPLPTNIAELRQYMDTRLYAIDIEAANCEVRGNQINLQSAAWGGIRISGVHVTVADNTLDAVGKISQPAQPASIYCLAQPDGGRAADNVVISGNRLRGPQTGIMISRIDNARTNGNRVDGGGMGWYGLRVDDCTDATIDDNDIQNVIFAMHLSQGERNRVLGNRIETAGVGISTEQETDIEISGNTISGCLLGGMGLFARGATNVIANRVRNCGYSPALSVGIGVIAEELYADSGALVRIEECEVIDTGINADASVITTANALGITGWMQAVQMTGNRVGYSQPGRLNPAGEHRAVLLLGPIAYRVPTGAAVFEYMIGSALLSGNHFRGPGRTHLVEFVFYSLTENIDFRFEKVTFSNNICDHLNAQASQQGATVRLRGGHLIAIGNHVKGPENVNAMSLANRNQVALMGNVTTGGYIQVGTVIPSPITSFNVRV